VLDVDSANEAQVSKTGWVKQIQEKTACTTHHGSHCYVDEAGLHWKLGKANCSYWSMMVVSCLVSSNFNTH
jgi:hypothetical protein